MSSVPFSERRHLNRKHIEAIKEVFAEAPIGDSRFQVAIRSRDDTHVDMDRLHSADSLKFSLLQDSQERDLCVGWKFTDLIQEDRPAIGQFKTAKPSLRRSGEGAFFVAKQF